MITNHNGDILQSGAPVIVHQVNCKGVMGAGLAKQVRILYPSVYTRYQDFSVSRTPAQLLGFSLWTSINKDSAPPFIVNCYAQNGFGRGKPQTDYGALESCFRDVKTICESSYKNCTIAIPDHIGCGLAGGDWQIVQGVINNVFESYLGDVQIWRL